MSKEAKLLRINPPLAIPGGEVTIDCSDSVWAQELDLMQAQLLERLRERLGERGAQGAPQSLRFRVSNE